MAGKGLGQKEASLAGKESGLKITVNLKQVGKKKNAVREVVYQVPGEPESVRELIESVVAVCVEEYNERADAVETLQYMTKEQVEAGALAGKVGFGLHYGEKKAELQAAVENALLSFEDGIYRIFMDGRTLKELDEKIKITEESKLTFIRLVMLAGRMW